MIARSEYEARRTAFTDRLRDGVVLALGAREPAEDYLSFYQAPSFDYLTGIHEPDAALVMVKRGGRVESLLFVQPHDPAREVWTGARMGATTATAVTGIPARDIAQLRSIVDSLLTSGGPLYVVGDFGPGDGGGGLPGPWQTRDAQLVESIRTAHRPTPVQDVGGIVLQLRGTKSAAELAQIRRAAEITAAAQREAFKVVAPGRNEYEVQATIEYTFRRNGADRPSFASIVGSGPNATTLHYNANDRVMQAGEVVVLDIGASEHGYAADVTRTVPVTGVFSEDQRRAYQVVRDAQAAAERQARLGAPARLMEDSATAVLERGLTNLGLIDAPGAVYDCGPDGTPRCPQYRLYYMHGLGHGIGLEVHDPDQYYVTGRIAPGSAFTIEPGIYVRANLLDIVPTTARNRAFLDRIRPAVERYRNLGIRIEDDYIASETGVEWVSRVPREVDEVEQVMRSARPTP